MVFYDRNSKKGLIAWAKAALADSKINAATKEVLLYSAMREIEKGGLRGDVSAIWMVLGWTLADIPDMYT